MDAACALLSTLLPSARTVPVNSKTRETLGHGKTRKTRGIRLNLFLKKAFSGSVLSVFSSLVYS
jgi:hypothetical protein